MSSDFNKGKIIQWCFLKLPRMSIQTIVATAPLAATYLLNLRLASCENKPVVQVIYSAHRGCI